MRYALRIPGHEGSWLYAFVPEEQADPPTTAVVFVHGFLGDAEGTWYGFPQLLPTDAWWNQADLYFFKYDSFKLSIRDAAKRFYAFLAALESPPDEWFTVPPELLHPMIRHIFPRQPLPRANTRYTDFILVGHSLGGVVLREAVLIHGKRFRDNLERAAAAGPCALPVPNILNARLRLFAPALFGARAAGLMGLALELGGISHLAGAWLGRSRSYQELNKKPHVLTEIADQTRDTFEAFRDQHRVFDGFRADVLWADEDNVVADAVAYRYDREASNDFNPTDSRARTTHVTVCKPTHDDLRAFDFVKRGDVR